MCLTCVPIAINTSYVHSTSQSACFLSLAEEIVKPLLVRFSSFAKAADFWKPFYRLADIPFAIHVYQFPKSFAGDPASFMLVIEPNTFRLECFCIIASRTFISLILSLEPMTLRFRCARRTLVGGFSVHGGHFNARSKDRHREGMIWEDGILE